MGTLNDRSGSDPSYPRRPATVGSGGGACVVVGARESRVQGKGRQGTDRRAKTEETPVDSGDQADEAWLLGIQRKLYQQALSVEWDEPGRPLRRPVELDRRSPQSPQRLATDCRQQRQPYRWDRRDDSREHTRDDGRGGVPRIPP